MAKPNITLPNQVNPERSKQLLTGGEPGMMNSKEVSEITGKRHSHVVRDVRKMLLDLDDPDLGHEEYQELKDARGYTRAFLLNEELTLTLVSGYNVKMRNSIIKRWKELESGDFKCLSNAVLVMFYADGRSESLPVNEENVSQVFRLMREDLAVVGLNRFNDALKYFYEANREGIKLFHDIDRVVNGGVS